MEDSKLPGASTQPPAPSPVGAGVLSGSALSGERHFHLHEQRLAEKTMLHPLALI